MSNPPYYSNPSYYSELESIYFAFTKNPIILSLFKIDTLNFTMYISTILTCPLKSYGLHI